MHVATKAEINSQLSARDDTGNAAIFAIQIDPFGKTREGYDFTVMAANVQSDIKYVHDNSYTLDVSLIPDFSQALSDNQIFNLSPYSH